jgi:hypothetical protein
MHPCRLDWQRLLELMLVLPLSELAWGPRTPALLLAVLDRMRLLLW